MRRYQKITHQEIKGYIQRGEHFASKAVDFRLSLQYPKSEQLPRWLFVYRKPGKPHPERLHIGYFPVIGIAVAKDTAEEYNALLARGIDPAEYKAQQKEEQRRKNSKAPDEIRTVSDLCRAYRNGELSKTKSGDKRYQKIEKDIIPLMGNMLVAEVTPIHIDKLILQIMERNSPKTANAVLSLAKSMFGYAVKRFLIERNPAREFSTKDAGGKDKGRKRWLNREEITWLFEAMRQKEKLQSRNEKNKVNITVLIGLKILLATGCREMEIFAAKWEDIDFNNSSFAIYEPKNGIDITIPFTPLIIGWIKELKKYTGHSEYLFPALSKKAKAPTLCAGTINNAIISLRAIMPECEHFVPHDLRHTMRSHLSALGVSEEIAERCLNHKRPGIVDKYTHHNFIEERRKALNLWTDLLAALEKGENYNVTPINKAV
ncbi:TPA: tyrosine-type recombinase/integrase [Salmonella enterica]|uniref:Tyrosine-type recombinase/integrase n=1 Tax=Salmonella enterica TaxID=28901 RepID=A0A743PJ30_SALER|nr:tyrosine-type recombinase/integrase [Salmonella enterica]